MLIQGAKTIDEYLDEKSESITDARVFDGLRNMTSNGIAALVLFWIELYREKNLKMDIHELKNIFSLEHIMPQKWNSYWGVESNQVFDEDGEVVNDLENAQIIRSKAVYMIGNMTLLTTNLNSSLRNQIFSEKIMGDGQRKKGIKAYYFLSITKEIVDQFDQHLPWDERIINERTKRLYQEFIAIW